MLDKSVTYKPVIMKLECNKNEKKQDIVLPKGYTFLMYQEGLENEWAKTQAQVLEFDTSQEALSYFRKDLLPYKEQLRERMVFVKHESGEIVANACAWYVNYKGIHQAQVHYVGVRPNHQELGIGKAIFHKVLALFSIYEPNENIYLHTQTWSHVAIQMYLKMGFQLIKDEFIGYYQKDYDEAVSILREIYNKEK